MTDVLAYLAALEGTAPLRGGPPGAVVWKTRARAFVAAAPAPGASHLLVLRSGSTDPSDFAPAVLEHASAHRGDLLGADLPARVAPGLVLPHPWTFDTVVAFPPSQHGFERVDNPRVHERTIVVAPCWRWEVPDALSERHVITLRSPQMVAFTRPGRRPDPVLRARYEMRSTRSVGTSRGLTKLSLIVPPVETLWGDDRGFVELENYLGSLVTLRWRGTYRIEGPNRPGDGPGQAISKEEIGAWIHEFLTVPDADRRPVRLVDRDVVLVDRELGFHHGARGASDGLVDGELREELQRLSRAGDRSAKYFRDADHFISCQITDDDRFVLVARRGPDAPVMHSEAPVSRREMIDAFLSYGSAGAVEDPITWVAGWPSDEG